MVSLIFGKIDSRKDFRGVSQNILKILRLYLTYYISIPSQISSDSSFKVMKLPSVRRHLIDSVWSILLVSEHEPPLIQVQTTSWTT
jgi:hypothetical protein